MYVCRAGLFLSIVSVQRMNYLCIVIISEIIVVCLLDHVRRVAFISMREYCVYNICGESWIMELLTYYLK